MSLWYTIKDKEDVSLSLDGKSLDVCFSGDDHNGNIYVEIPIEYIKEALDKVVGGEK